MMKKMFAVLAVAALFAACSAPALAAGEWNFYGQVRMSTFWEEDSSELTGTGFDDDDLGWGLQGNSRVGAKVKMGAVGGGFEYGVTSQTTGDHYAARVRKLYGTWDFGSGVLLVGRNDAPLTFWVSNQVWGGDNDLLGVGQIFGGRQDQVKVQFGNFELALIDPNETLTGTNIATGLKGPSATASGWDDTDTTIPKIEAAYTFSTGPLTAKIMAGYNQVDAVDQSVAGENENTIDSYIAGVGFKYSAGPLFINGNIFMAQNIDNYGLADKALYGAAVYSGGGIEDSETLGYVLVAGMKVSDMLTFEAGYGALSNELEYGGIDYENTASSYYVNATINLAKGVFIVPEVGRVDYGDDEVGGTETERGDTTYFGAKWQINF